MYLNIKVQVFKLGIRQNDVARELQITESMLSKIIHGYRQPSKTQRLQLARYLNAEESWLFEKYDRTVAIAPIAGVPAGQKGDPS